MAGKDRLIGCHDLAGRPSDIIVLGDRGRLVMICPPGETAVLTSFEVGQLRAALRDVMAQAADGE